MAGKKSLLPVDNTRIVTEGVTSDNGGLRNFSPYSPKDVFLNMYSAVAHEPYREVQRLQKCR